MDAMVRPNTEKSLFERVREIPTEDIIETSYAGAHYISWAKAWTRLKEYFPDASWKTHEFTEAKVPYLKTEFGIFVRVSIFIEDAEETEDLTIMDNKMQAIMTPDGRDIMDAIKRCGVKAMALHGFGIECWMKDDVHAKEKDVKKNSSTLTSVTDSPLTSVIDTTEDYEIPFKWKTQNREIYGKKVLSSENFGFWLETASNISNFFLKDRKPIPSQYNKFLNYMRAWMKSKESTNESK